MKKLKSIFSRLSFCHIAPPSICTVGNVIGKIILWESGFDFRIGSGSYRNGFLEQSAFSTYYTIYECKWSISREGFELIMEIYMEHKAEKLAIHQFERNAKEKKKKISCGNQSVLNSRRLDTCSNKNNKKKQISSAVFCNQR